MNNSRKKNNFKFLKILLVILFISIISISCSDEQSDNNGNNTISRYTLSINNWTYSFKQDLKDSISWLNIKELPSLELDDKSKDGQSTIYFKYQLPHKQYQNPAIFIGHTNRYFQAYFNDSLIYSYEDIESKKLESKYNSLHIINLHNSNNISESNDLVLKMKLQNYYNSTNFILSEFIFLDSIGNIYKYIYKNDFIKVFSSLFLILISLIAISVSVYLKNVWSFLELNLFVFFLGVFLFIDTNLSSILINQPLVLHYLYAPPIFLSTILLLLFINRLIIDKFKIYIRIIAIIHIVVSIVFISLDLLTILLFDESLDYYFIILLATILVIVIISFKKPFKENSLYEIFFIGLLFFFAFSIIEIILFLFSINYTIFGLNLNFVHIGAIVLVLSWAILYLFKYINAYGKYIQAHQIFSRKILDSQNSERKRIAQNLHDATGHDLLIIKNLSQLAIDSNNEKKDISDLIEKISEISDEAVARIRVICKSLYPPVLENLGLTKALKALVENSFKNSNIEYNLEIEDIDNFFIKSDYIHIYRIIQEIFNNVLKHSKATEIDIIFKEKKEILFIIVTDNGIGIDKNIIFNNDLYGKGFGLSGITERVQLFKGKFNLQNLDSNKGLEVSIELPFN